MRKVAPNEENGVDLMNPFDIHYKCISMYPAFPNLFPYHYYMYRVFFNEESKVSGQKSIQNLVSYANFEFNLFVIVANLIIL